MLERLLPAQDSCWSAFYVPGAGSSESTTRRRRRDHENSGKSEKRSPLVTLHFDSVKKMTIAVLASSSHNRLASYFQNRVQKGTAYLVSPLYFELDGYIRENLCDMKESLPRMCGEVDGFISIAIGSLEESDREQRYELMGESQALSLVPSGIGQLGDMSSLSFSISQTTPVNSDKLEQVLEIASLHRLNDDLDVISIYFMRLVNKVFARVSAKLARNRLQTTRLLVTPFVNGIYTAGYSRFIRRDGQDDESISLVRHLESSRTVEYERGKDMEFCAPASRFNDSNATSCVFYCASPCSDVSWKCEEIALANLHRWWGDISLPDYVGQKLLVSWILSPVDAKDHQPPSRPSTSSRERNDSSDDNGPLTVPVATLRLPVDGGPPEGVRDWPLSFARMRLDVRNRGRAHQLDDVTVSYSGKLSIEHVHLDFPCLVRASAKAVAMRLVNEYTEIEQHRPLLPNEEAYRTLVEEAANME